MSRGASSTGWLLTRSRSPAMGSASNTEMDDILSASPRRRIALTVTPVMAMSLELAKGEPLQEAVPGHGACWPFLVEYSEADAGGVHINGGLRVAVIGQTTPTAEGGLGQLCAAARHWVARGCLPADYLCKKSLPDVLRERIVQMDDMARVFSVIANNQNLPSAVRARCAAARLVVVPPQMGELSCGHKGSKKRYFVLAVRPADDMEAGAFEGAVYPVALAVWKDHTKFRKDFAAKYRLESEAMPNDHLQELFATQPGARQRCARRPRGDCSGGHRPADDGPVTPEDSDACIESPSATSGLLGARSRQREPCKAKRSHRRRTRTLRRRVPPSDDDEETECEGSKRARSETSVDPETNRCPLSAKAEISAGDLQASFVHCVVEGVVREIAEALKVAAVGELVDVPGPATKLGGGVATAPAGASNTCSPFTLVPMYAPFSVIPSVGRPGGHVAIVSCSSGCGRDAAVRLDEGDSSSDCQGAPSQHSPRRPLESCSQTAPPPPAAPPPSPPPLPSPSELPVAPRAMRGRLSSQYAPAGSWLLSSNAPPLSECLSPVPSGPMSGSGASLAGGEGVSVPSSSELPPAPHAIRGLFGSQYCSCSNVPPVSEYQSPVPSGPMAGGEGVSGGSGGSALCSCDGVGLFGSGCGSGGCVGVGLPLGSGGCGDCGGPGCVLVGALR